MAAFIIGALVVFLIFWYKRRKAEKKRQKEEEVQHASEADEKLSEKAGSAKGPNETTAMGLKGEKSHVMNRSGDPSHDEDGRGTKMDKLSPRNESINDYDEEEEEKVEKM